MGFRITTWNVNGIRNPFGYQPWREQRSFQAMFDILEADIVVMQETKIQRKDLQDDMVLVPGWDVYFSLPRHKKGYSGVAIYTRNATCAPIRAEEGITGVLCPPNSSTRYRDLPQDQRIGGYPQPGQLASELDELTLDSEGRCVILEFPAFVLLGVYSPANRDESRNDFRLGFLDALDVRVRNLVASGKQVILTGDLNVSRSELDSSNILESLRKEGMSLDDWMAMPARRLFNQLIFEGQIKGPKDPAREKPVLWDLCRSFHPTREGMNTCWDTKRNTRPANNGSRIDYVLCSDGLKRWCTGANIQEGLMGSDHCPVFATFSDTVTVDDTQVPLVDLVNPPGMFSHGQRVREWGRGDLLPMSAKLIPQFDRRQNIRDMFKRQSSNKAPADRITTPKGTSRADSEGASASQPTSATIVPSMPQSQSQSQAEAMTQADSTIAAPEVSALDPRKDALAKRSVEMPELASRSQKRSRVASDLGSSKLKVAPGQTTLKGFFKSASTTASRPLSAQSVARPTTPPPPGNAVTRLLTAESPSTRARQGTPNSPAPSSQSPEKVFDAVESKEQWSKLLGKRQVPRCEHNEPCISLVTKKAGLNCGRTFYICPRPLGPSGEKEKDTEWRCGTFIWSSDWNSTPSR
ncbi:Endonuclease/exonuclease/phosphatase [Stachybotrys elegans]|uniref:DNA-(apurinic or apyrimidinic site) endonuclease 2 n=1 Tax=Stachybotrys elegans TaxID=80388 RepID=A0A8K0WMM8_9HYPO|nr:Endonuclease/exonuclease/phosphatase [Stachybotrys elegans]